MNWYKYSVLILIYQLVIYILCFDLAQTADEQIKQVAYWLNFLNSALPLPPPSQPAVSNWSVMITGLRSDLQAPGMESLQQHHISSWAAAWSRLPIIQQLFFVSSQGSNKSVLQLFHAIQGECSRIFDSHTVSIPSKYRMVIDNIRHLPNDKALLHQDALIQQYFNDEEPATVSRILKYLHAVGRIICMKGGLVFTNPQVAPKMAAMFVSPIDVRIKLLRSKDANVQILEARDVGSLLALSSSHGDR